MVKIELEKDENEFLKNILSALLKGGQVAPTSRNDINTWNSILDKFEIKDADKDK